MPIRYFAGMATLAICMAWLGVGLSQAEDAIDWNRAKQLHQRFVRGEKLTEEEQAYHDRAAKALQSRVKQGIPSPPAKPPAD